MDGAGETVHDRSRLVLFKSSKVAVAIIGALVNPASLVGTNDSACPSLSDLCRLESNVKKNPAGST